MAATLKRTELSWDAYWQWDGEPELGGIYTDTVSFWTEDTARTTGFIDSEPLLVTQNRFYFRIKHYVGLLAEAKYIKKVQWDT
jgi:hypothetical protein